MADILVIEDDLDLAWTLEQLLSVDGHAIRVAHNGEEAMGVVAQGFPDLVITDLEMPILGGEGLVYRLFFEDCGREDIPIVIISGYPDLETVAKRIATPYFISKPYEVDKVIALVNRALAERIAPRHSKIG